MSRINTNVGSLVGRNNLAKANNSLNESLTRLSTGMRINTGKDDPAGLIASENLRSDITSIKRAISNTDRANQVIATADSALGQVSSLLNDIRGLVTESANAGALSDEQIAANQLQVDSSLEALNRIAQTTTFQGRRLLDGSLDFLSKAGANPSKISDVQIDQANLGASGSVAVDVNVSAAATQASVAIDDLPDVTPTTTTSLEFEVQTTAATGSTGSVDFDIVTTDSEQATGTFETSATGTAALANSGGDTLTITGPGDQSFTINITDSAGAGPATATYDGAGTIAVDLDGQTITTEDLATLIEAELQSGANALGSEFTVAAADGGVDGFDNVAVEAGVSLNTTGSDTITVTALDDSIVEGLAGNDIDVAIVQNGTTANGVDSVTFDGSTITINADIAGGVGSDDIAAAIAAYEDGDGNSVFASTSDGTSNLGATDAGRTIADVTSAGVDEIVTTETIDITGTTAAGEDGNVAISFAEAALGASAGSTAVIGNPTAGYTVQINTDNAGGVAIEDIRAAIESINEVDTAAFNGTPGTSTFNSITVGPGSPTPDAAPGTVSLTNGTDQETSTQAIDITTAVGVTGTFDINFSVSNLSGASPFITGGAGGPYTVNIDNTGPVTVDAIRAAIESIDEVGTATLGEDTTASTTFNDANGDAAPATLSIVGAGEATATTGINADLVFEVSGSVGSEVLSFESGTTITQLLSGINAISDATGVVAELDEAETGIVLNSTEYGSKGFVDLQIIKEGNGSTPAGAFTTAVGKSKRAIGADVAATVNGISANGNGNSLSINTATLDLSATLAADFVGSTTFTITGGGAKFQLGPDVVSNQQARLGIGSVNTSALGGIDGLLYELGNGESADLSADPTKAAKIVEDAIDQVTSLRGRLGAFQRTSLETNKNALNDTLTNLTEAESTIRDADFAEETANLTRSQILVQSGTRVLGIANQNPQNVLALLG